jgi:O-antigen/teichoic acid export membrane protein
MVRSSGLSDYRAIWRDQSRWTLTGVISTELTANAHSWLVGLIAGPAALAPIAAAALLFRPVMLVATSLTQLERPILTRALVAGNETLAQSHVRLFRSVLAVALLVTIAGGAVILLVQPHLLIPDTYALADARLAFVLIGSSVALSVLRTPDSVVLQAMGQFRSLALASVTSGVVALAVAVVALFSLAPVFSIIGPVAGQVVLGTLIASTAKRAWANAKKDEPCQKS